MNDVKKIIAGTQAELAKCSSVNEIKETLKKLSDHLQNENEIKYGCYCDLEEGQAPDDCVYKNRPFDCIYASDLVNGGKTKWDCKYWKVIGLHIGK